MCDDQGSLIFYTGAMVFEEDPFYNVEMDHLVHEAGTISFRSDGRMICDNFETDHLGSTRRIVRTIWGQSTTGDVTNYYPFGLAWNSQYTNLDQNKYLFSGKELQDAAVGRFGMLHLYDFGSRFYNPTMARWFNVDPALQGVNPYVYCGNSPVVHVDPDGEFWHIVIGAVVGGIWNVATNWDNIDNFGDGLASFGIGAASGALTAVNPALGATVGSAFSSAGNNVMGQLKNGGNIDIDQVFASAGIGFAAGAVTFGVGAGLDKLGITDKFLNMMNITNSSVRNIVGTTLNGAMTGSITGITTGIGTGIAAGDWNLWDYSWRGGLYGTIGGFMNGTVTELGYQAQLKWGGSNSKSIEAGASGLEDGINGLNKGNDMITYDGGELEGIKVMYDG